jgi:hypothetical protein
VAPGPPHLYVLPWLHLHGPESFGAIQFSPAESCLDPADPRTAGALRVLGCYKGLDGRPVAPALMWIAGRGPLDLDERVQLLFDQFEESWLADPEVSAQAQNNTYDNFRLVFDRLFLKAVVDREEQNQEIVRRILDDEEFGQALKDLYAARVYQRARDEGPKSGTERPETM